MFLFVSSVYFMLYRELCDPLRNAYLNSWLLSLFKMESAIWVQIQNKAVSISVHTNDLEKDLNPSIFLSAMSE